MLTLEKVEELTPATEKNRRKSWKSYVAEQLRLARMVVRILAISYAELGSRLYRRKNEILQGTKT